MLFPSHPVPSATGNPGLDELLEVSRTTSAWPKNSVIDSKAKIIQPQFVKHTKGVTIPNKH